MGKKGIAPVILAVIFLAVAGAGYFVYDQVAQGVISDKVGLVQIGVQTIDSNWLGTHNVNKIYAVDGDGVLEECRSSTLTPYTYTAFPHLCDADACEYTLLLTGIGSSTPPLMEMSTTMKKPTQNSPTILGALISTKSQLSIFLVFDK